MKRPLSYRDAINEAIIGEMERDSSIIIYGIDVSDHKRIFGSTKNILEKFGPTRCFSTPLCEDTLVGFGLGAAVSGLRPINVHMRVDFLLLAMNQLANMVSSFHYGSGGRLKVPLVIRAIIGRGWGQSFQHSKSMQSVFAHIPGLRVIMPTRASDAKGLLISAIRDDNPVIFIEHRWLYDAVDDVPEGDISIPIGEAAILHQGSDITIIATSWMNVEALKAAEIMAKYGVSVEVIDPRTISPLQDSIFIDSVKKTKHCIVADNDWIFTGFSAELATRVYDACFNDLKSPITRVGFAFTPCPCTRSLENEFYPNAIDIIKLIEKKLDLDPVDLLDEDFYSYENKFKGPF